MLKEKDVQHVLYSMIRIYLAGGMNTFDWQRLVKSRLTSKQFVFFNPREHGLTDSTEYTMWDLFYVKKCDILFAYMQSDNPSGIGLTLEVGFARALDKTIILIDEKSDVDTVFAKKFEIVRESASKVYNNLEDGITFLSKFKDGVDYK